MASNSINKNFYIYSPFGELQFSPLVKYKNSVILQYKIKLESEFIM